jgi:hypothetical protein
VSVAPGRLAMTKVQRMSKVLGIFDFQTPMLFTGARF